MRGQLTTVEQKIARIANRQHGVVARAELRDAGLSEKEIDRRVDKGILLVEYRGVYRVGHRSPSVEAHYIAAVKACGDGAVLSGRAAAFLYGLLKGAAPPPEVTTPTKRSIGGLKTRRGKAIEATKVRGIPVTTVPRTLVDLAAVLDDHALARACHEAGVRYGTTPRQVEAVLRRHPRSKGAAKLRRIMSGDVPVSLSNLEAAFIALLRRHRLPVPRTNKPAGTKRVDCRWPDYHLTVELQSYQFHNTRHSWQQDYERQRQAYARDDAFREYTWADVFEDSTRMLAELRELLT